MRNWSQRRPISLGIGNAPRRSSIVIADTAGKLGSDRSNSSRQLSLHSEPSCRAFRPGNRDPTDRYDTYNNFVRSCRDRNPIDFAWRETVSDETVCHSFRIFPFDLMGDLVGFDACNRLVRKRGIEKVSLVDEIHDFHLNGTFRSNSSDVRKKIARPDSERRQTRASFASFAFVGFANATTNFVLDDHQEVSSVAPNIAGRVALKWRQIYHNYVILS